MNLKLNPSLKQPPFCWDHFFNFSELKKKTKYFKILKKNQTSYLYLFLIIKSENLRVLLRCVFLLPPPPSPKPQTEQTKHTRTKVYAAFTTKVVKVWFRNRQAALRETKEQDFNKLNRKHIFVFILIILGLLHFHHNQNLQMMLGRGYLLELLSLKPSGNKTRTKTCSLEGNKEKKKTM